MTAVHAVVGVALCACAPCLAQVEVLSINYTEIEWTLSPFEDPFIATDVFGALVEPGGIIVFSEFDVGIWNGSGDPNANTATFDLGTGDFETTFGVQATFLITDAAGAPVGSGVAEGVFFEVGVLEPTAEPHTYFGAISTPMPFPMQTTIKAPGGDPVAIVDVNFKNIKNLKCAHDEEEGDVEGEFLEVAGIPSVEIFLPRELGGGVLEGTVVGTFLGIIICPADCDGDGVLTILDFVCFQGLFSSGDAGADCNADGSLNILDFLCFQNAFQQGCP